VPQPIQIVEVQFPPRGRVAFETGARGHRVHQQVWVRADDIPGYALFPQGGLCSMTVYYRDLVG
jgi:hypothetical protein